MLQFHKIEYYIVDAEHSWQLNQSYWNDFTSVRDWSHRRLVSVRFAIDSDVFFLDNLVPAV